MIHAGGRAGQDEANICFSRLRNAPSDQIRGKVNYTSYFVRRIH